MKRVLVTGIRHSHIVFALGVNRTNFSRQANTFLMASVFSIFLVDGDFFSSSWLSIRVLNFPFSETSTLFGEKHLFPSPFAE